MKVLVRYADGSLFDGSWEDAPIWDVLTVAYVDPNGQPALVTDGDYFSLEDDRTIIPAGSVTVGRHAVAAGAEPGEMTEYQLAEWAAANGYKVGIFVGYVQWNKVYQLGKQDRDSLR